MSGKDVSAERDGAACSEIDLSELAHISCEWVLLIFSFEKWRKVKHELIYQICECGLIAFLVEASC